MIELKAAIAISVGMIIYYTIFQVLDNWMKVGSSYDTTNRTILNLMSEYQVNIRIFRRNTRTLGFAWFRSIWINDRIIKNKKKLLFVFFHEYYHLKHRHKAKMLLLRLTISLLPLLLVLVHWGIICILLLGAALGIYYIKQHFEKSANEYASKMYKR